MRAASAIRSATSFSARAAKCSSALSSSRFSRSADLSRDWRICSSKRRSASSTIRVVARSRARPRDSTCRRSASASVAWRRWVGLQLLPLDLVAHRALARPQALADLVQRAPPLRRVRLDLERGGLRDVLRHPLEVLAELGELGALLGGEGLQVVGVGGELDVVGPESLALALGEVGELRLTRALAPVEVVDPALDLLLELALRLGDTVDQALPRLLELDVDEAAALVGQAPFLLGEEVAGLGPLARDQPGRARPAARASARRGRRRAPASPARSAPRPWGRGRGLAGACD